MMWKLFLWKVFVASLVNISEPIKDMFFRASIASNGKTKLWSSRETPLLTHRKEPPSVYPCDSWLSGGLRWRRRLALRQSASQIFDYTYIKSRAGQQLQFQLCGAADRYFLHASLSSLSAPVSSGSLWLALCDCDFAHEKQKQTKPENVALHTESIMFTYIHQLYSQIYLLDFLPPRYIGHPPCMYVYICLSLYLPYYWHAAYLVAGLVTLPCL